jgi:UDP-N-acetylglucosamine 2-epimerase (non-hydrolysing)
MGASGYSVSSTVEIITCFRRNYFGYLLKITRSPQTQVMTLSTFRAQSRVLHPNALHADRAAKTVVLVFGTRPEAIKLASVLRELKGRGDELKTVVVNTGQHDSLLAPFLAHLGFQVDHDLKVMTHDQSPNTVCSRVLAGLDDIFRKNRPDLLIVQGDTTTALAGALAAFNLGIPVGHVEAGLRSFDVSSPFPEEMNRTLISRLSTWHFAATSSNMHNLVDEGISPENIFVTGNPVVDSLQSYFSATESDTELTAVLKATANQRRILLTTHRRESFGETLKENLLTLRRFVASKTDVALIFPVHPNPVVRKVAQAVLAGYPGIYLMDPLPHDQFLRLMAESWLIVSDSGGVQEEAPTLGKPLLVLRENTERPEALECGTARLVGGSADRLASMLHEAYSDCSWSEGVSQISNPFGDGKSGLRIASLIAEVLGVNNTEEVCVAV